MAKDMRSNQMALPNPFQNAVLTPVVCSTISKTMTQNDTRFFHGYRSTFSIDQQKEQYQELKNQQQQQQKHQHQQEEEQQRRQHQRPNYQTANQFNRNAQHRNHQTNQNAAPKSNSNHTNAAFLSNWCDLCERGFKFPYQLGKHRSEHEKCWFDDCTFEGHSQLLKQHIEVQHQSKLFQRNGNIETDEDVEKWREERRKRYPTAANIEARRRAQEERLKRGERIQEPANRFGNINNRKRAQQRSFQAEPNDSTTNTVANKRNDKKRRRPRHRNKNRLGKEEHFECEKNESETTQNETAPTTMVNTETVSCVTTVSHGDSVERIAVATTTIAVEKMAQNSSALAAIMGMYGSDSDGDDDDVGKESVEAVMATATTTMIEDKKDENECLDIGSLDQVKEIINVPKTEPNLVKAEETVNLKRSANVDDELPNKQTKIDSDLIEHFNENITIESDDEAPEEQPIQRQSDTTQETVDLYSGPTKTKPMITTTQKLTNERIPKRKTVLDMTRKIRNQNSLLEKLLQKDIRHERNVLLQCVRYVVEQNFFGIGQSIDEQKNKEKPI